MLTTIIAYAKQGKTGDQIAQLLKIHPQKIYTLLRENGTSIKSFRKRLMVPDYLIDSYANNGITAKDIAKIMKITSDKLRYIFKRMGIKKFTKKQARNEEIKIKRYNGMTLNQLAKEYSISRERIRQICK